MVFCLTDLKKKTKKKHCYLSNRRIQERDKQRLDRVQQEEELQWQKKNQEDEKQKREEITKKKESEDKGKQEIQEKLSKLSQPHQEPVKPAVQAPWSNAGRGRNQEMLLHTPFEEPYVSQLNCSFY